MTRESTDQKARRYLGEARLTVTRVVPGEVDAVCRGDGAVYRLAYRPGQWRCTCPSRGRCAHLVALGLVVAPNNQPYR